MRATIALVLTLLIALPAAAAPQSTDWHGVVRALPPLSSVAVHTVDGKTIKGTVVSVGDEGFELQRRTRYPEPPRLVRFDTLIGLEHDRPGMSSGAKATAIAAAVAAALGVITLAVLSNLD